MRAAIRAHDPLDQRIAALRRRGLTFGQIADQVGKSRSLVAGRIERLGLMGHRIPERAPLKIDDRIAEAMAEHDAASGDRGGNLIAVAAALDLELDAARQRWAGIVRKLGWQAA